MTLEYKIIVIDDQPGSVRRAIEEFKDDIKNEGFHASHETINSADGLAALSRRTDLMDTDLMLIDRNLGLEQSADGQAQDGATVIRRLRNSVPHMPVLFYSGDPAATLRARVAQEKIDGVFCCHRTEIRVESLNIFNSQAKSLLRPMAIRGYFVGEASQLDLAMRRILHQANQYIGEPGTQRLKEKLVELLNRLLDEQKAHIESVAASSDLDHLLDGQRVSSSQILGILLEIMQLIPEPRHVAAFSATLNEYLEDVLQTRNVLAHGGISSCGRFIELGARKVELTSRSARAQRAILKRHGDSMRSIQEYLAAKIKAKT